MLPVETGETGPSKGPNSYESARVAVDAVLFSVHNDRLLLFLGKREKDPFQGSHELLGGLLLPGETAEETLRRKVLVALPELEDLFFQQFFTFTAPNRDPRVRTVSIGFFALVPGHRINSTDSWYPVEKLPPLAFDHTDIVRRARNYLASRNDFTDARYLLPKLFTLNSLHRVAELIHDTSYDNRNFRRLALASNALRETSKMSEGQAHRPAKLYEFLKKRGN